MGVVALDRDEIRSMQGMQINPGVKTIEGVLEAAIHKAGGISRDNAGDLAKVNS